MNQKQLEHQAQVLRGRRIVARFEERERKREARGGLVNGLAPGWSDATWLASRVQKILRRHARRINSRGDVYQTELNNVPLVVLPSGRIVVYDEGAAA